MTSGRVTRRLPPQTLHGGKPGLGGIGIVAGIGAAGGVGIGVGKGDGSGVGKGVGLGVGKGVGLGVGKGVGLGVGTGVGADNMHPHGAVKDTINGQN